MKKKIVVFTSDKIVSELNSQELRDFFGEIVDIEGYSLEDEIKLNSITADLVLTLSNVDTDMIRKYLKEDTKLIQATRTILLSAYTKLKKVPNKTKAILMSITKMAVFDLASFLINIGINNIEFYMAYKGIDNIADANIIITPMDLKFNKDINKDNKDVINLEGRRLTIETYRAVMMSLNIYDESLNRKLKLHSRNLINIDMINLPLSMICNLENTLNTTLNEIDDGVMILNQFGKIIYVNKSLIGMMNIKLKDIQYKIKRYTI